MDFLNQAFAQISDLFKSMTAGARITSGLLLAVVIVSLVYLFNHQAMGPDEYLMGGEPFSSGELAAAEAAFDKAGLKDYEITGNRVAVPRAQRSAYMGALADVGAMPESFGGFLDKAMAQSGPFQSGKKQAAMLRIAKQSELSLIMRSMKGIDKASVLYDVDTATGFRKTKKATATVSVRTIPGHDVDTDMANTLRHLVAGAYAQLRADAVTVIDLTTGTLSAAGNTEGGGMGAQNHRYLAIKQEFERRKEATIRRLIAVIPGSFVAVNVELTPETEHSETTAKPEKTGVPIVRTESTTASTSGTGSPGGRPGLEAQSAGAANSPGSVAKASRTTSKSDETSDTTEQLRVGGTNTTKKYHGLIPTRVTASIGIPASYWRKVWEARNPTAEGEVPKLPKPQDLEQIEAVEIRKFRESIAQLIKLPISKQNIVTDPTAMVTIKTFQDLPTTDIPDPSFSDHAMGWFGTYWSTLGMAGLALFSLLTLRSMVRAGPARATGPVPGASAGDAAPAIAGTISPADAAPEDVTHEARLRRFGGQGPSLRDELAEVVREDPDAAAGILRGWINAAG